MLFTAALQMCPKTVMWDINSFNVHYLWPMCLWCKRQPLCLVYESLVFQFHTYKHLQVLQCYYCVPEWPCVMNPFSFPQPKILFRVTSLFSFVGKHTARLLSTAVYAVPPGPYRNSGNAVFAKNWVKVSWKRS